jgi:transposase, IS5 family
MVSLLVLQRMFNVSDEDVVKGWVQNPYWQHLSGMTSFQWRIPCDPTELVKFRQRIGLAGAEKILAWTISCHRTAGTVQANGIHVHPKISEKSIQFEILRLTLFA